MSFAIDYSNQAQINLRRVFTPSLLLKFCPVKELTAQTGHEPFDWPIVIVKELVDNALDICQVGVTVIESHGTRHTITFKADQVRQEPVISIDRDHSFVRTGT